VELSSSNGWAVSRCDGWRILMGNSAFTVTGIDQVQLPAGCSDWPASESGGNAGNGGNPGSGGNAGNARSGGSSGCSVSGRGHEGVIAAGFLAAALAFAIRRRR
jgi:MYXO-CTERM domain-containing protein